MKFFTNRSSFLLLLLVCSFRVSAESAKLLFEKVPPVFSNPIDGQQKSGAEKNLCHNDTNYAVSSNKEGSPVIVTDFVFGGNNEKRPTSVKFYSLKEVFVQITDDDASTSVRIPTYNVVTDLEPEAAQRINTDHKLFETFLKNSWVKVSSWEDGYVVRIHSTLKGGMKEKEEEKEKDQAQNESVNLSNFVQLLQKQMKSSGLDTINERAVTVSPIHIYQLISFFMEFLDRFTSNLKMHSGITVVPVSIDGTYRLGLVINVNQQLADFVDKLQTRPSIEIIYFVPFVDENTRIFEPLLNIATTITVKNNPSVFQDIIKKSYRLSDPPPGPIDLDTLIVDGLIKILQEIQTNIPKINKPRSNYEQGIMDSNDKNCTLESMIQPSPHKIPKKSFEIPGPKQQKAPSRHHIFSPLPVPKTQSLLLSPPPLKQQPVSPPKKGDDDSTEIR